MIVATAGHVDHGKTSLVRQLTGVDTDRLAEEKRRGLSINLGFAYRQVTERTSLGFVDVPGHTRFINTMISGVGGIDLGMLVVAADDGIMPQTREHLDVMRLLGIREFIAVISKIDRVDAQRAAAVEQAVIKLLAADGNTASFAISNSSGAGIAALYSHLEQRALAYRGRSGAGNFRLSVDRAFLLRGTGLVLTGTALAGTVAVGDALQLLPAGIPVRVRSLHVNASPARQGQAGERCAVNVSGAIHRNQVNRGDVLAADPAAPVSARIDARLCLLSHAPFAIKHLSPVTLHIGAKRLGARLYLLENGGENRLTPGERALVQLILAQPLACCRGDRFLLRDDSQSFTLGGGIVLDPMAPGAGKASRHRLGYLTAMAQDTPLAAVHALLEDDTAPVNLGKFRAAWNLSREQYACLLHEPAIRRFEAEKVEYAVTESVWGQWGQKLLSGVQDWQQDNPGEPGIRATTLQAQFARIAPGALFRPVLSGLLQEGALVLAAGLIHTRAYEPRLSGADQDRWQRLARQFEACGLRLPLVSELVDSTGLARQQVLADLQSAVRSGRVVKVNDKRYALPRYMAEHAAIITALDRAGEDISVVNFRDRIQGGRRLAIDILEYFDGKGFTQRRGELRVILNPALPHSLFSK